MTKDQHNNQTTERDIALALAAERQEDPRPEFINNLEIKFMNNLENETQTTQPQKKKKRRKVSWGIFAGSFATVAVIALAVVGLNMQTLDTHAPRGADTFPIGDVDMEMMPPVPAESFEPAAEEFQLSHPTPMRNPIADLGGGSAFRIPQGKKTAPAVPIDDVREFMQTDYRATIKHRRPTSLASSVQEIIHESGGRIDAIQTKKTRASIDFVVPAESFSSFTIEMRDLVTYKNYDESIASSNVLEQIRVVEDKLGQATTDSAKEDILEQNQGLYDSIDMVTGFVEITKNRKTYGRGPLVSNVLGWVLSIGLPLVFVAFVGWIIHAGIQLPRVYRKIEELQDNNPNQD